MGWGAAFVALALTGCGNRAPNPSKPSVPEDPSAYPQPPPGPTFLYVLDPGQTILTYAVNEETGALSLLRTTSSDGAKRGSLLVEPTGRVLFHFADVTTCCHSPIDTDLRRFDLASDGTPMPSGSARLPLHDAPVSLASSPRFVYSSSRDIEDRLVVYAFPVGSEGGEGAFYAQDSADVMVVAPTGRILYAAGSDPGGESANLRSWALGPDGLGREVGSLAFESTHRVATRSLAIHPNGHSLYGLVEETDALSSPVAAQIRIVATDESGRLESAGFVSAPVGQIVVHPGGRFLFHARGSEIAVYAVEEGQAPPLTLLYRIDGGDQPPGLGAGLLPRFAPAVDPSGRFLFGNGNGGIWGYAFDPISGGLRYLGILAPGVLGQTAIVARPPAS